MNLNNLTNQKLDEHLKSLVTSEREILSDILVHIKEVDRRKLFLVFGFGSLFEYLTKSVGYANGCAQRRIDAARLSLDVPDVILKIESGELNLSQMTLVQKAIRQVQSKSGAKVNSAVKEKLVCDIATKSFSESEVIVAQTFNLELKESTTTRHQRDESVRLEVTLSKAQWEKMLKMRELLSHSLPDGSWDQVLEYVSDRVIRQKDKSRMPAKTQQKSSSPQTGQSKKSRPIKSRYGRKPIPIAIQRQIFQQSRCCQFENKSTGQKCGSRWQLSIDHIKPIWAGGGNEPDNLRVLCANHNREVYKWQSGITHEGIML